MQEILEKRSYTAKHFDNGDGTFTMKAFQGHEHYKDAQGDLQEVDFTFEDMGSYWQMAKASYNLYIAKDFAADQLIRFDNKFDGANHTIYYEPKMLAWVNNPDLSDMQVFRNQQAVTGVLSNGVVRYTDAFGAGIHFEISLRRSGFKKEIVIDAKNNLELPPTADHKLVALFRYQGDGLKIVKQDAEEWNRDGYFEALDGFDIAEEANPIAKSLIRPAYIVDDGALEPTMENIKVFWKLYNGSLWQAKVLSKTFLENAVYPVRADTVTDFDSGAGDGMVRTDPASPTWNTAHDDPVGTAAPTATQSWMGTRTNDFLFERGFFPIDTSGLPDGATISAASFFAYIFSEINEKNDGTDYLNIVQTTQASTSTLVGADLDNCGAVDNPPQGATAHDFGSFADTAYLEFVLNATGLGWISLTSYTALGLREGHDIEDLEYANSPTKRNIVLVNMSEYTSNQPYLSVTYTEVSAQNSNFLAFMQ